MEPTFFTSPAAFRTWLEENHDTADELWVGYYKKDAEQTGIGYGESVEEAICFGWIDGLINGIDDETYTRRFTPRDPDSKWSKTNRERVEAMIDAGKMTPAGMELIEAAKEPGEWENAYRGGSQSTAGDRERSEAEREGVGELPDLLQHEPARVHHTSQRGEDDGDEGAAETEDRRTFGAEPAARRRNRTSRG